MTYLSELEQALERAKQIQPELVPQIEQEIRDERRAQRGELLIRFMSFLIAAMGITIAALIYKLLLLC